MRLRAAEPLDAVPAQARSPKLQPLLDRVRRFAAPVQKIVLEGVRRAIDYQDPEYAKLYLDRLEQVRRSALDGRREWYRSPKPRLAAWRCG